MKNYSKFLDSLEKVEKAILAVTFGIMVAIMTYQIILRYLFKGSNAWSEELTRYLFILNVMIACAIAVRNSSHLQIDIIIGRMQPRTKAKFTVVTTLIGIVFLVFLAIYSFSLLKYAENNISPGLGVSMIIPYASVPLGCALMILTSIEVIMKNISFLQGKIGEVEVK